MLEVRKLTKKFRIPHEKRQSIRENIFSIFKPLHYEEFRALDNVSFRLEKGEWLGLVGSNGSGKSTLLKILAGIYHPNNGEVIVQGKMVPFLELGVGFNPELSGRDNVYLNSILLGMPRTEVDKKFDQIVKFSELEKFLDTKLKNYSSGMQVRLAFSIASQIDADIYLLDEVLAVGDIGFQDKCQRVFRLMKEEGKTVILVSHDLQNIEKYCSKTIWLEKGKIKAYGPSKQITTAYWRHTFPDEYKRRLKLKRRYGEEKEKR